MVEANYTEISSRASPQEGAMSNVYGDERPLSFFSLTFRVTRLDVARKMS